MTTFCCKNQNNKLENAQIHSGTNLQPPDLQNQSTKAIIQKVLLQSQTDPGRPAKSITQDGGRAKTHRTNIQHMLSRLEVHGDGISEPSATSSATEKMPPSIRQSIKTSVSELKAHNRKSKSSLLRKITSLRTEKFECPICCCTYPKQHKESLGNCAHSFCKACLTHYMLYKIARFEEVYCPEETCQEIVETDVGVFKPLDQQKKNKYRKIHATLELLKNPRIRVCPEQKCQGTVDFTAGPRSASCSKCGRQFCGACFFPRHKDPCAKNEVLFFQDNLQYRQCSNCKIVVEKTAGCNHMVCQCKHEFCYACGKKIVNGDHVCTLQASGEGERPALFYHICYDVLQNGIAGKFLRVLFKILFCFPAFVLVSLLILLSSLMIVLLLPLDMILRGTVIHIVQGPWMLVILHLLVLPVTMMLAAALHANHKGPEMWKFVVGHTRTIGHLWNKMVVW